VALPTLNLLSVCAGYGGIDLGLRIAEPSARTVCYMEIEATVASILAARFQDGTLDEAPIWSDLRTFRGRAWRGAVDIIAAGYPCQPFSCAGKQRGKEDPRYLWPQIARIIREVEPEWVFLENVANHLRIGFSEVQAELRGMGYRVACGLFSAEEVGAPHLRLRLFALAHCASFSRSGGVRRSAGISQSQLRGAKLAHGQSRGRRVLRQSSASIGLAGHSGAQMAHPESERSRETGRFYSESSGRIAGRREELADPECPEWRAHVIRGRYPGERIECEGQAAGRTGERSEDLAHAGRRLAQPEEIDRQRASSDAGRTGRALADAGGQRRPIGQGKREDFPKQLKAAARGGLPIYCPGPDDIELWRELLAEHPEVEPAIESSICRAFDGSPSGLDEHEAPRTDRLRALGSGVVPIVAGFAFRTLLAEHCAGRGMWEMT
jgi:DNA (cytosine-5)-methyltransferase 1